MSLSTLREQIDSRFFTSPYIIDDARQSYAHWWRHLGYMLDIEYDHILLPDRLRRRYMQRYHYTRYVDHRPLVEHTVVLPTGEEITYEWKTAHSPGWRCRGTDKFREKRAFVQHGVEKKQRDDAWREHKQFARDKGKRKKCQRCCGRWMKTLVNRENRRANKRLIYQEKYEQIPTLADPVDRWRWD